MREILVAYPSKDTALKLRSLLEGEGYDVPYVCSTAASELSIAHDMSEEVVYACVHIIFVVLSRNT